MTRTIHNEHNLQRLTYVLDREGDMPTMESLLPAGRHAVRYRLLVAGEVMQAATMGIATTRWVTI
jgi:hypothetical protein